MFLAAGQRPRETGVSRGKSRMIENLNWEEGPGLGPLDHGSQETPCKVFERDSTPHYASVLFIFDHVLLLLMAPV